MKNMILGIDPGASGGIAFSIHPHGALDVDAVKMPDTPKGILDMLKSITDGMDSVQCFCERVGTYRPGNSAVSACKFARHCGALEMAFIALEIPTVYVVPNKWMKTLGTFSKEKVERKKQIKQMMEQRYPKLDITLAKADALGILTYGIVIQQS